MPSHGSLLESLLHQLARLPPAVACLAGSPLIKTRLNSTPLLLNPCDPIHQEMAVLRTREPWFTRILEAILTHTRPRVVFDVGANVGYYLTLYHKTHRAHRVPSSIVAFEPSSRSLPLLKANAELHKALGGPRVRVLPIALGDRDATVPLREGTTPNLDHIAPSFHPPNDRVSRVVMRRLDTLLNKDLLPCPHLLRMDIEGYEHPALQGAVETLGKCKPLLALELHPDSMRQYGADARELLELLEKMGYGIVYHEWGPKTTLQTLTPKRGKYQAEAMPTVPPTSLTGKLREGSMIIATPYRRRQ